MTGHLRAVVLVAFNLRATLKNRTWQLPHFAMAARMLRKRQMLWCVICLPAIYTNRFQLTCAAQVP